MKLRSLAHILTSMLMMVLLITISLTRAEYLQSSDPLVQSSDDQQLALVKRPFCNAFTGCGRKRSDIESEPIGASDVVEGSANNLFLQKLGRHILRLKAASQLHTTNNNYEYQPWNYDNKKNEARTPWLDYMALGERKKRMASPIADDHNNVEVI